jgi:glycosyltransferase involved in cell wall biosynthesis
LVALTGGQTEKARGRITVVVPVLNAMHFLPRTVPSLIAEASRAESVELLYIDNGSLDGSLEYLGSIGDLKVLQQVGCSIGALRNYGATKANGDYLSFLDADCTVSENYFSAAISVLSLTGAEATGCEVAIPPEPHWIEATWHDLHYIGRDRDVAYINSANFFVSRRAFEHVGGFREDLLTGEDSELGRRLVRNGYRIRESPRVGVVHLGNPKSIRAYYRRTVWHGLGMFGTVDRNAFDKPTAMMTIHLVCTILGLVILLDSSLSWSGRIATGLLLQFLAPSMTVAYRARQTRRITRIPQGIILYWLYYWARVQAFVLILIGRGEAYAK